jgi:hypothetical protein
VGIGTALLHVGQFALELNLARSRIRKPKMLNLKWRTLSRTGISDFLFLVCFMFQERFFPRKTFTTAPYSTKKNVTRRSNPGTYHRRIILLSSSNTATIIFLLTVKFQKRQEWCRFKEFWNRFFRSLVPNEEICKLFKILSHIWRKNSMQYSFEPTLYLCNLDSACTVVFFFLVPYKIRSHRW